MVIDRQTQGLKIIRGLVGWGFKSCYLERTKRNTEQTFSTVPKMKRREGKKQKTKNHYQEGVETVLLRCKIGSWRINTCALPEYVDESVGCNMLLVPRGKLNYRWVQETTHMELSG